MKKHTTRWPKGASRKAFNGHYYPAPLAVDPRQLSGPEFWEWYDGLDEADRQLLLDPDLTPQQFRGRVEDIAKRRV